MTVQTLGTTSVCTVHVSSGRKPVLRILMLWTGVDGCPGNLLERKEIKSCFNLLISTLESSPHGHPGRLRIFFSKNEEMWHLCKCSLSGYFTD